MDLRYTIEQDADGWGVFEGGSRVSLSPDRARALETARLLALGAKAAGGDAKLFIRSTHGRVLMPDHDAASLG